MSDWFRTFFDGLVVDFWQAVVPAEITAAEAAFLQARFPAGAHVLDVACGVGRHAVPLAAAGRRVTALDVSAHMVGRIPPTPGLTPVVADVRHTPFLAADGAYWLGNGFGYLPPGEMEEAVAAVAAALRPGAPFVLDTSMCAESLFPMADELDYEGGGVTMHAVHAYDPAESRLDTTYTFTRGEERTVRTAHNWIVTTGGLVRMLHGAGFEAVELAAGLDGAPYVVGAPRLVVTCRRAAPSGAPAPARR